MTQTASELQARRVHIEKTWLSVSRKKIKTKIRIHYRVRPTYVYILHVKRLQADFIIMAGFTKTSRTTTICRLCILDLPTKRRQSHTGRTDERHPPVPVFESSKILDWSTQARSCLHLLFLQLYRSQILNL